MKYATSPLIALCMLALTSTLSLQAHSQSANWKPAKNVEIIVGAGPGGGLDRAARTAQKLMQEKRLVSSSTVINKPGGGQAVALAYLNKHAGDGHFLQIVSETPLTNEIMGRSPIAYADYTPIARLFNDYMAFVVHADSAIKTGRDIVQRLRKDPAA